MIRGLVRLVAVAAIVASLGGGGRYAAAESRQELSITGRVTPSEWHDALGVYSQRWEVTVTVHYGGQAYEQWTGPASSAGMFRAPLHRDRDRSGERIEVRVNGAFLYGDRTVEVTTEELELEMDSLDIGTIAMQRQR